MSDRELLELAAKAHGNLLYVEDVGSWIHVNPTTGERGSWWHPLTDDGDALRLAVKLGISIDPSANAVVAITPRHKAVVIEHGNGALLIPATRRAIVRAAVEIGKAHPQGEVVK